MFIHNFPFPPSSKHVEPQDEGKDDEEEGAASHLQCVRVLWPGADPGVQGSVQHDRPEPRRLHRQGRPARHAGITGWDRGQGALHVQLKQRLWRYIYAYGIVLSYSHLLCEILGRAFISRIICEVYTDLLGSILPTFPQSARWVLPSTGPQWWKQRYSARSKCWGCECLWFKAILKLKALSKF